MNTFCQTKVVLALKYLPDHLYTTTVKTVNSSIINSSNEVFAKELATKGKVLPLKSEVEQQVTYT